MLFNSIEFLLFFPVVTLLFFLLPHKVRWILLLAASTLFYMAFVPKYILILAATILADYAAGLLLPRFQGRKKKLLLTAVIIFNIGILFFFKYFNFFNSNLNYLASLLNWNYSMSALDIVLPIGLSFHTFQSLSYVLEVYRGNQEPEKHFGIYSLYVMFYPQLVAGPIERPGHLLNSLHKEKVFSPQLAASGLRLMLWGFFKKIVIADNLSVFTDTVYSNPGNFSGAAILLATYFFAFQIYCDFSGYTDIARGAARVMGFDLMRNFRTPYFSKNPAEFWNRWHISLSSWFRDYVYFPLGGSRTTQLKWMRNVVIVFFLSGLWHGAKWTFVFWGLINGFYLIAAGLLKPSLDSFYKKFTSPAMHWFRNVGGMLLTFHLICFSWIFFRADSFRESWLILDNLLNNFFSSAGLSRSSLFDILLGILLILVLIGCDSLQERGIKLHGSVTGWFIKKPLPLRWSAYGLIVLLIFLLGVTQVNTFIYFQF